MATLSCASGEITNFENIQIELEYRADRLDVRILLLDRNRKPLILSESILTPQIGVSVLSESEFTTNAKIYSVRRDALLFRADAQSQSDLDVRVIPDELRQAFENNGFPLSQRVIVSIQKQGSEWLIVDRENQRMGFVRREEDELNIYQGVESAEVYDGRIRDLHWATQGGTNARMLRGEIRHRQIREDPQRNTEIGSITLTIQTDKQGPFSDTLHGTRIYRNAP
ncbi:MAG: hypothetical protein O7E52_13765 [Candidatus Poribacteria bacterium]|nr:hypothetical protein [Candidatus Poribacteria bacterium]